MWMAIMNVIQCYLAVPWLAVQGEGSAAGSDRGSLEHTTWTWGSLVTLLLFSGVSPLALTVLSWWWSGRERQTEVPSAGSPSRGARWPGTQSQQQRTHPGLARGWSHHRSQGCTGRRAERSRGGRDWTPALWWDRQVSSILTTRPTAPPGRQHLVFRFKS